MTRWFSAGLAIVAAMAVTGVVTSAPQSQTELPVGFSARVVNNVIVFTAVTPRRGSSYRDEWSGPNPVRTTRRGRYYVAQATLNPPVTGTYGIIYRIWQWPGRSHRIERSGYAWGWLSVTVAPDGTLRLDGPPDWQSGGTRLAWRR